MSDALAPFFPPADPTPDKPQRKTRQKRVAPPEAPVIEAKKNRGRPRKVAVRVNADAEIRNVLVPEDDAPRDAAFMAALMQMLRFMNGVDMRDRAEIIKVLGQVYG